MWKTKFFYKLTLPLIISLIIASSIFAISFRGVLHKTMYHRAEEAFFDYGQVYSAVIDTHLSTLKTTALQIGSRTQIRLQMQKLYRDEISASDAEDYIYPKLADAVVASENVHGVIWVNNEGAPIVSVGTTEKITRFENLDKIVPGDYVYSSRPVIIDNQPSVLVITRIYATDHTSIGFNLVYFSLDPLLHLLSEKLDNRDNLQLVGYDTSFFEIINFSDDYNSFSSFSKLAEDITPDEMDPSGLLLEDDVNLMALIPVEDTQWYILNTLPKQVLNQPLNRLLSIVFLIIFSMSLIMISAIWRIVVTSVNEVEKYQIDLEKSNESLKAALKEQKRVQDQFVRRETLAALGELVGGLMHELNTPIGSAVTSLSYLDSVVRQTLTTEQLETTPYSEAHKITETNLNKAITNIETFRVLNMDQATLEMRRIHLKKYVDEILLSLKPKLKVTQHEVCVHCDENLHVITTPGILSQIITNLVINSLIHGFENIDQGTIELIFEKNESELHLIYKDNGVGIPEENLKNVFKPYFTTKRHQGGTGLGLHIIYALIVDQLSGQIEVKSKTGEGVRFDIRFPVSYT